MKKEQTNEQRRRGRSNNVECVTRWGLVILAAVALLGAVLRMFAPEATALHERLDQTTLLYLAVAGALLLLRQVKSFSLGQLKFELIEKLRERQAVQEQKIDDIRLILPLLLPSTEVKHLRNIAAGNTERYAGNDALRAELRRLRSIGLVAKKAGRNVADIKDGMKFDLADYVELTELGRKWAARIPEIEAADAP
jgi:hypothetical protein